MSGTQQQAALDAAWQSGVLAAESLWQAVPGFRGDRLDGQPRYGLALRLGGHWMNRPQIRAAWQAANEHWLSRQWADALDTAKEQR